MFSLIKKTVMKSQILKSMLFVLAMCLTATSANAQRDRNYVKNQIKKWGSCKNVAITKTNGDVALYGTSGYACSNVPTGLANTLKDLNKKGTLIDDVQLTESGKWCVLFGKNDATWTNNIPSSLAAKIHEFHDNNYVVRSITFNDYGQWVIVSDQYYATSSQDLTNWLKNAASKWGRLWAVCLTDDAAVAVFANGFAYRGNIPEDLKQALRSTSFDVFRLKVSGVSWFFADQSGNYRAYM